MFKIVEFSHYLITEHYKRLNRNDLIFVDATCGMGNDSLFMAETLNHTGHLVCYDIQDVAISTTKELLTSHNYLNVEYKQMSHEFISEIADLIIYNCGYLPGHDKSLTTKASSTLASVKKALSIMAVNTNLLIIIVLYPGHPEGKVESDLIDSFAKELPSNKYLVSKSVSIGYISALHSPSKSTITTLDKYGLIFEYMICPG